jgi:hypothetical protein
MVDSDQESHDDDDNDSVHDPDYKLSGYHISGNVVQMVVTLLMPRQVEYLQVYEISNNI